MFSELFFAVCSSVGVRFIIELSLKRLGFKFGGCRIVVKLFAQWCFLIVFCFQFTGGTPLKRFKITKGVTATLGAVIQVTVIGFTCSFIHTVNLTHSWPLSNEMLKKREPNTDNDKVINAASGPLLLAPFGRPHLQLIHHNIVCGFVK